MRPATPASRRHIESYLALALTLPVLAIGCHRKPAAEAAAPAKPAEPPHLSEIDLKTYKPNETGAVMILMYHRINAKEADGPLNRQPDTFRKDLEELYKRGYRPATVQEFIENRMDVPAGKTPIVLTFDDALLTQFKVVLGTDGKQHIDPNCAVGIMETFNKAHKDWPVKATFFVLPKEGKQGDPFGQPESVAEKFDYLLQHGCEIGDHTSTHPMNMRGLSADKIQWEIATAFKDIKQIAPKATMTSLALPYGLVPRNKDAQKHLISGTSGGTQYEMKAVLKAAWRPVRSAVSKPDKATESTGGPCSFNAFALERITPDPMSKDQVFEYWLKYFDEHPGLRYVSDGNLKVVAVPKSLKSFVDPAKVQNLGQTLQLYTFGGGSGGAGGGGLSVQ